MLKLQKGMSDEALDVTYDVMDALDKLRRYLNTGRV